MVYKLEISRQQISEIIVEVPDGTSRADVFRLTRNPLFLIAAQRNIEDGGDCDPLTIDAVREASEADISDYGIEFQHLLPL